MVKDKSADKRDEYNQKILQTMTQLDEIKEQRRQLKQIVDNYEMTATREFSKLMEIDSELMKRGSFSAQWDFEENRGKAQFIKDFLMRQQDELRHAFSQEIHRIENKQEQFQRERDELPWE